MKIDTLLSAVFQVLVPGSRKSVMLEPLLSDTEYKITVNPIYPEGEDSAFSESSTGHTRESPFLVLYCHITNDTLINVCIINVLTLTLFPKPLENYSRKYKT